MSDYVANDYAAIAANARRIKIEEMAAELDQASGADLDQCAETPGLKRNPGESDTTFRTRIAAEVAVSMGKK